MAEVGSGVVRELNDKEREIRETMETWDARTRDFQTDSEQVIRTLQESLDQSVQEARDGIAELGRRGRALEEESLAALTTYIQQQSASVREELEGRIGDLASRDASLIEDAHAAMESRHRESGEQVERRLAEMSREFEQHVEETKEHLRGEISTIGDTFQSLSGEVDSTTARIDETLQLLNSRVDNLDHTTSQQISEIKERLESHAYDVTTEIEGERQRLTAGLAELSDTYRRDRDAMTQLEQELQGVISRTAEDLSGVDSSVSKRVEELETRLASRIDTSARTMETQILSDLEKRLTDYEKGLNYRFTKIESVNHDIDNLEEQMRSTMDRISERIRGDFLAFGEELRELREADRKEGQDAMELLRQEMGALENGLNELKERAYENVSEKLKVFEDEFFADLKTRSNEMEDQIHEWRENVHARLAAMEEEHYEARDRLEASYDEELRSRIGTFQEQITGQLRKTEQQIETAREGLHTRLNALDEQVLGFDETIKDELESLKDRSFQTFRAEFSQANNRVRDDLKSFETEVDEQIAAIRSGIKNDTGELENMVEASRSDVAVWQTEVLNKLRSGSADVNNQLADTKVRISENLQELKREFSDERNELVEESKEERSRIREEIGELSTSLDTLQQRLATVSRDAMEGIQERYRTIRKDIDEHESEVTERIDDRSTAFRELVEDTHRQFQAMRERLLGKLEEESRTLETTLTEIDKRQRSFIEQTKIFDRADSLKIALDENIEELKAEISRVEGMRGEIRDIEGQFAKIRKMSADMGEKMARFSADKRRIDLLEEDYKRLITLAQSVEQKIDHVGNSDEQLRDITARLKSLDELQEEVEVRFERLEKRRSLIDQTADGLESNSRALETIESRIGEITDQIEAMPASVNSLASQLKKILAAKKDTDTAVTQLANLEQTLADVESRMSELQTAREWLARTETRLEEIRRDAGEQVKLLGSIMREEARKNPSDGGAPSLSARETVQKLAHQGWKVDEIARATKVSKGEVELILELTGKK